jgi:hypothetical protein
MRGGDCDIAIECLDKPPSYNNNNNGNWQHFANQIPFQVIGAEKLDNSCLAQFFKILKKLCFTDRSKPPVMTRYDFRDEYSMR